MVKLTYLALIITHFTFIKLEQNIIIYLFKLKFKFPKYVFVMLQQPNTNLNSTDSLVRRNFEDSLRSEFIYDRRNFPKFRVDLESEMFSFVQDTRK